MPFQMIGLQLPAPPQRSSHWPPEAQADPCLLTPTGSRPPGKQTAFLRGTQPSPAQPEVSERPRLQGMEGAAGKASGPSGKARPPALHPPLRSLAPRAVFTHGAAAGRRRFSSNQGTPCPWTTLFCRSGRVSHRGWPARTGVSERTRTWGCAS